MPPRGRDEAHLINAAPGIHADDPAFGYRFTAGELAARGVRAGENKVARLCSQQRVWPVFTRRRGLARKAGPPGHDDLAARQVTAPGPGRAWLAGLTGHPAGEGKRHPGAINDAWPDRIAGYSMGSPVTAGLAVSAPGNAIALRSAAGTVVVHPGGGSQVRSAAFVRTLAGHGLTGSVGRAGARGGNAAVGSFFALLHKNVLGRQRWITREQLRLAIITWVERTCRRRRRQRRPGRLTPVEYETISQAAPAA